MAERKVLNKYFPPDFDPSKVPTGSRTGKAPEYKVRLMAPFSMQCNACAEYINKGKKFNARKENLREDYLGIRIFRFWIRCPQCSAEIAFKTDPKNAEYICEDGATRNFESWREEKLANEAITFRKQMEEDLDPMKKLENRQLDSRREIDILEALDELRTRNARNERADADHALEVVQDRNREERNLQLEEEERQRLEDEKLARFYCNTLDADGVRVKRLAEQDETVGGSVPSVQRYQAFDVSTKHHDDENSHTGCGGPGPVEKRKRGRTTASDLGIHIIKSGSTQKTTNASSTASAPDSSGPPAASLSHLMGAYDSDSENNDGDDNDDHHQ